MKKFLSSFLIIFIIIVFIASISYASDTSYVWSPLNSNTIQTSNQTITDLNIESESCILIEQNSGQILYEKNSHDKLRPASVTKIMSILLIMDALDSGKIKLTDKVPCSENAAHMGGSQIWLDTKEELTVDEMLKAICVVSANDCCVAMAEFIEGSTDAFVKKMNDKAKQLGMNDTCFKNCHGIDEDDHLSSSYDIALMSRALLNKYPQITKYTTIYMDTLRDGKSELVNTNKLIRNYKGATGLKTGSTSLAMYNLSASATRDDLSLIAVIMKAPSTKIRFSEAEKLLDYGFSNYSYKEFAKKGDVLKTIDVNKAINPTVNIVYNDNAGVIIKKGENDNVEQIITLDKNISAPIIKNQKLGEITFILNGKTISKIDLVSESNVDKINLKTMIQKVLSYWSRLLK